MRLITCAGSLADYHDDPTDHFSRLNLLSTQLSILLRSNDDTFLGVVRTKGFLRDLSFNLKALLLPSVKVTNLEDWMMDHEKETKKIIIVSLMKVVCRMIEGCPEEAASFFKTHYRHKEHFVNLVHFVDHNLHLDLLYLFLSFANSQLNFSVFFAKALEKGLDLKLDQLETLLLLSGKEASLPNCLAVVRLADEVSSYGLAENLVAVCDEEHLETIKVALEGTKNLRSVVVTRKKKQPMKEERYERIDEFKALLDDKSYIEKVRESVLEQVYDEDGQDDDDPVDIHADSKPSNTGLSDELIRAYIKDPEVFGRGVKVRQSDARRKLCERLKMTHEQVEGWAIMLSRNPKKESMLRDYQLLNYKDL